MNALTIALYDIATIPCGDPEDEPQYVAGVVRFVTYRRDHANVVTRARKAENVHFGPVALLDDLFRPWVHAVVAYGGHRDLGPALVNAAVWPEPGIYIGGELTEEAFIAATEERLRHYGLHPGVARFMATMEPGAVDAFERRLKATSGHTRLIPPGAVGVAAKRDAVARFLAERTLDPLTKFEALTGHPHLVPLSGWRELTDVKPLVFDGENATVDDAVGWWAEGRVWDVVDYLRNELDVLEDLVNSALFGGPAAVLRTNAVSRGYQRMGTYIAADVAGLEARTPGGRFRYAIPTGDWWDQLVTIAKTTRL